MKKITTLLSIIIAILFSANIYSQSTWKAPKSADAIENPFKGDLEATKNGKKMFSQLCAICHGEKGKGDGMAGVALNPRPGNFTSNDVQSQSDGALFWKLTNGSPPMAAYKEILTENERWQLINYLRTFKKQ